MARYALPSPAALVAASLAATVALSGCGRAPVEPPRLAGRVVTADGGVPRVAHVHLERADGDLETTEVGADGRFELALPEGELHVVRVSAVDHEEIELPLLVAPGTPDPLELEVTLRATPWKAEPDSVGVVGPWEGERRAMTRRDDGTWSLVVETAEPEIRYELVGLADNGHTVNDPSSERFEYDGGGDYYSLVAVPDGRIEIVVDPRRLPRPEAAATPGAKSSAPVVDRGIALAALVDAAETARRDALRAGETVDEAAIYAEAKAALAPLVADEKAEPALRRFAAGELMRVGKEARADVEEAALALLPAASPSWSRVPWSLLELDPSRHGALLEAIAAESPSPVAQGAAVYALAAAAKAAGDDAAWRAHYERLTGPELGETIFARFAKDGLDPDTSVAVGQPLPAFSLTLDDGSTMTAASLAGTPTLIDFWATWCLPCVAEMPILHEARRRYPESKLRILSVSFDVAPGDVAPFRATKWPMPWLHAYAAGGMKSPVADAFNVRGIPKPVFAGPDGTILALGEGLRGEELLTVLERELGPGAPDAGATVGP